MQKEQLTDIVQEASPARVQSHARLHMRAGECGRTNDGGHFGGHVWVLHNAGVQLFEGRVLVGGVDQVRGIGDVQLLQGNPGALCKGAAAGGQTSPLSRG